MEEVWKEVPGYEGLYQVSNLGRVKSLSRIVKKSDGVTQRRSERIVKKHYNTAYGFKWYAKN